MNRLLPLSLAAFIFTSFRLFAQQYPLSSQYMFNKMIYNPASTGADTGHISVKGLYMDQWLNYHDPEGARAPISEFETMESDIHFGKKQSHPYFLGLGMSFSQNIEGFINQHEYFMSAAFHYLPKFGGDLSLGINAGTVNDNIIASWNMPQPIDPYLLQNNEGRTNYGLDAGLGLNYSTKDYYLGVSCLNIPKIHLELGNSYSIYPISRTYTISGGYNFYLNHDKTMLFQPSFLYENYNSVNPFIVSGLLLYKQRFWAGLDLRYNNFTNSSVLAGIVFAKTKYGDASLGGAYAYQGNIAGVYGGIDLTLNVRIKI